MNAEFITPKTKTTKVKPRPLKVGDHVTFAGSVLRVLDGEDRPLVVRIEGSGAKIVIRSHWFDYGHRLRGSDHVTLTATVTRVADGAYSDFTPISMEVDGYTVSRVTLAAKFLTRVPT